VSFLTLYSDDHTWLATDQRVYAADEIKQVSTAAEQAEALTELVAIKQWLCVEAAEEAKAAGYEAGQQQAQQEMQEKLATALTELHAQHEKEVQQLRDTCASLGIDIVRKIAANVAPANWLYALATQAATELVEQPSVVLRVHPTQLASVQELYNNATQTRFNDVVADETLAEDGCVLETPLGTVDIDLDTQLATIHHLLTDSGLQG